MAARLELGLILIVLPSNWSDVVLATDGLSVTLVLLTVLESIPRLITRLIILLTGTPVAALAGSELSI